MTRLIYIILFGFFMSSSFQLIAQMPMHNMYNDFEKGKTKDFVYDGSEIVFLVPKPDMWSPLYKETESAKSQEYIKKSYDYAIKYNDMMKEALETFFKADYIIYEVTNEVMYTEDAMNQIWEKKADLETLFLPSYEYEFLGDYRYAILTYVRTDSDYYLVDLKTKTLYKFFDRSYPIIPDKGGMRSWELLLGKLNGLLGF